MATVRIRRGAQLGKNAEIEQIYEVTASAGIDVEETIGAGAADVLVNISIDISALKAIYIESTQDITIETENATTPTDTLNVKKDSPLAWDDKSHFANPFSADVTKMFITNGSATEAADVKIKGIYDATP